MAISATFWFLLEQPNDGRSAFFVLETVDRAPPADPWGKTLGDVDGDGLLDIVVGGHGSGELAWYQNPSWERALIARGATFSTDHVVADLDGDGVPDIASLTTDSVVVFFGPNWQGAVVDRTPLHDLEAADLDGDGDLDLVARHQTAFGGSGATLVLYENALPGPWVKREIGIPEGEGLALGDINRNGRIDVLVNRVWLENPGGLSADWLQHLYAPTWDWPHVVVATGDLNGDGYLDAVLGPAEPADSVYRLSYFAGNGTSGAWQEYVLLDSLEAVVHGLVVEDMDLDGDQDVAFAEMHQGREPHRVALLLNADSGKLWTLVDLSVEGSHNLLAGDMDGDGDVELVGANWSGEHQALELWRNEVCPSSAPWMRHVVDDSRPDRAVFVVPGDIDGDGFPDLATGGVWYRNPGALFLPWERRQLPSALAQIALLHDLDGDGDLDALGTGSENEGVDLLWAPNQRGSLGPARKIASTAGDFLQGVDIGAIGGGGRPGIGLSWHLAGQGVMRLAVPQEGGSQSWRLDTLTLASQDEGISIADLDGDGDDDVVTGTRWIEQAGDGWLVHEIDVLDASPDRNTVVDVDGDGLLDVVVGFEAISVPGQVVWYRQLGDGSFERKPLATVIGPMSLGAGDVDGDGDPDFFIGEHNLNDPGSARLIWLENPGEAAGPWAEHLVHKGDEHHDGAIPVDLDLDGDLDVVSIGWGHTRVLVYENRRNACRPSIVER